MSNLTCEQFKILVQLYNLNYMCLNYDIKCQKYCMEHNNCYCSCLNDQIYCVNYYDYVWRLFSVLISALFFAYCCYKCIIFFCRSNKNVNSSYQHIQHIQHSNMLSPLK